MHFFVSGVFSNREGKGEGTTRTRKVQNRSLSHLAAGRIFPRRFMEIRQQQRSHRHIFQSQDVVDAAGNHGAIVAHGRHLPAASTPHIGDGLQTRLQEGRPSNI